MLHFSAVSISKLTANLFFILVCYFISSEVCMKLCMSTLVEDDCLGLEIHNGKLKLKMWNSGISKLHKLSCQMHAQMKMRFSLPSGYFKFTMMAKMFLSVLVCTLHFNFRLPVYNFSVWTGTGSKYFQPLTVMKGDCFHVRRITSSFLWVLDNLGGPGEVWWW